MRPVRSKPARRMRLPERGRGLAPAAPHVAFLRMTSSRRLGRRALLGGGAVALAGVGLEVASLTGRFDHRRFDGEAAKDRFERSALVPASEDAIVHVGHSTHLLVVDGVRLLTDPWFYDPAFGALSHAVAPAVGPAGLGALDAILVTHDHADHADLRAMDAMDKRAVVFAATPELAVKVKALGFKEVLTLRAWEEHPVRAVTVVAVPALHDVYEVGYVVRGTRKKVYFAGDTRLFDGIDAIAERVRPDVAILPVDGTRLTGGALHVMNPADATVAARKLGSKLVLPSHAESVFSDPFAEHVLASTVAHAGRVFAESMARTLPAVRCVVPEAGERVSM